MKELVIIDGYNYLFDIFDNLRLKNNELEEIREKLIITQEELAALLGVSFASINRWETGKHEPTTKIKRKIVELCKENSIDLEGDK